ncbi:MAG: hypothetical protein WD534_04980 [Phycisphaeraceae bacterium]
MVRRDVRRWRGMRIAPACHSPALPLRCTTPEQVAVRACPVTVQYVGAAYAAQVTPGVVPGVVAGVVAEQETGPGTEGSCAAGVSGKWPWQLPPASTPPSPPPEVVYVPYPISASTRMGNLLDLLA